MSGEETARMSRTRARSGEQIPLDLGYGEARSREDLIVSDPLTAAVAIIDRWPDWSSPTVILCGPRGAGKSHLANIWREKAAPVELSVVPGRVSGEPPADRPVLLEDVDRAPIDETALFHLFNTVRENAGSMLMTSRLWPAAWPVGLPDLRSRLMAATVVEIGEPDDDLLAQVIVKLFSDRQIVVEEKVVNYLVARMERSYAAAREIVETIDRLALSRRVKITPALAGEALALRAQEAATS